MVMLSIICNIINIFSPLNTHPIYINLLIQEKLSYATTIFTNMDPHGLGLFPVLQDQRTEGDTDKYRLSICCIWYYLSL